MKVEAVVQARGSGVSGELHRAVELAKGDVVVSKRIFVPGVDVRVRDVEFLGERFGFVEIMRANSCVGY